MSKNEHKEAVKEALKEWLDEKFIELGKWSFGALFALILATMIYFILWANGWHNETVPVPNQHSNKQPFNEKIKGDL